MDRLIEALKTIKEECEKHECTVEGCDGCPFSNENGECKITQDQPSYWNIQNKLLC